MEPEVTFYNKETGKVVITLNTVKSSTMYTSDGIYATGGKGSFRIPRRYTIKNITGNEEIYNTLINHIGEIYRFESDQFNGLFEIRLKNDEIILWEHFQ